MGEREQRHQELIQALQQGEEQVGLSHEQFLGAMPAAYLARADGQEVARHYWHLARLAQEPGGRSAHSLEGDAGALRVQRLAGTPSYVDLLHHLPGADRGAWLLVIVAPLLSPGGEAGFLITAAYRDPEIATGGREAPRAEQVRALLLDQRGLLSRTAHAELQADPGGTTLRLTCANSGWTTLVKNLLETLESHQQFPVYCEVWRVPAEGALRNAWVLELCFEPPLDAGLADSLAQDLQRYIQQTIAARSVFDIVGPAMVGPSSSHTAGANRIGRIARNIILAAAAGGMMDDVSSLHVKLVGSFRDTGPGHGTPAALGGGLLGVSADDHRLFELGRVENLDAVPLVFGDLQVPFAGFVRGSSDDDQRYAHEGCSNVAEIVLDTPGGGHTITGFSLGGGNVEIRYLDHHRLRLVITGKEDLDLAHSSLGVLEVSPRGQGPAGCPMIRAVDPTAGTPPAAGPPEALPFNTFEELGQHLDRGGLALVETIIATERALTGATGGEVRRRMAGLWRQMREAVARGLSGQERSPSGMTGGDAAALLRRSRTSPLLGNIYGRALAYATAVSELNACHGVIVSCPTAGACGILPGVLVAFQEETGAGDEALVEGLLVAGFVGMLLFDDVTTAGADFGCQAEIGAGAAMTAAALTHLERGGHDAVIQAFTLALKNAMGLVCDPVAGLVEVPCVKRNGLYSSLAISAAAMALSGVRSFVSPDEVVLAVREVGLRLHRDYRETAGGGLARTRDGKRALLRLARQQRGMFREE